MMCRPVISRITNTPRGAAVAVALAALVLLAGTATMQAQVTGIPHGGPANLPEEQPRVSPDTLFLFTPARSLIDSLGITADYRDVAGIDILFSNSGFGIGGFYQHNYTHTLSGFINLGITGSRNRDEFDQYDYDRQDWRVPGKINRLYTLPLTIGLRYRLLEQVLVDNFRPYANVGIGPSLIVALPYEYEFFTSMGHASARVTAGGFVGIGAEIGGSRPLLGVNIRYFYIPLHPGMESLRNDPITNFGGLFLTMHVGFM